jgi:hypothetical protein
VTTMREPRATLTGAFKAAVRPLPFSAALTGVLLFPPLIRTLHLSTRPSSTRLISREQSAQQEPRVDLAHRLLAAAQSLRCDWDTGYIAFFDPSGSPWNPERPTYPPRVEQPDAEEPVTFDAIDRPKQYARAIRAGDARDVSVTVGYDALVFLEAFPTGAVRVTTVFAALRRPSRGAGAPYELLAVTSGHSWVGSTETAWQHYGTCVALQ